MGFMLQLHLLGIILIGGTINIHLSGTIVGLGDIIGAIHIHITQVGVIRIATTDGAILTTTIGTILGIPAITVIMAGDIIRMIITMAAIMDGIRLIIIMEDITVRLIIILTMMRLTVVAH